MVSGWGDVERRLDALEFSGVVLVARRDRTLLELASGIADRATGAPIHAGTRFALASLSKMFTAAAVLTCVRDGLVDVDARVVDVLPRDRRPPTMPESVTVHHLLTHTSGIADYAEEDESLPGYVADYGSLWREHPTYRMQRPDDYLPLYAEAEPVAVPGSEFHYCNAGYVLLGALLEQLTTMDFAEAVTARVLHPAGMDTTGYFRFDEPTPDLAVNYLPRPGDGPWRSNVFSVPVVGSGDGGAQATARDIHRFLLAVGGGELLGEELTRLVLTPHVPVGDGVGMGYGFFVGEGWFGHGGGDPGVQTASRHLPGSGTSLVVLCNEEGTFETVWDEVEASVDGEP